MNNNLPKIEPVIKNGGSAFRGVGLLSTRPLSCLPDTDTTKVVSLAKWCELHFISRDVGYTLIRRKLLIGFRQKGQWWVAVDPACEQELLDYLGVDKLADYLGVDRSTIP